MTDDRPAHETGEIEITKEMRRAGFLAVEDSIESLDREGLAIAVYIAMVRAKPPCCGG